MELWWRAAGWVRLRLTSADCAARLRSISREIRLERIEFLSELCVEFDTARANVDQIGLHGGETLEVVGRKGLPQLLLRLRRWKLLAAVILILGVLTVVLPGRIWFVRVEGSGELPARLILEKAEECGLYFGASRRELRSEQVKNHLLYAIPELRWAGVNTEGCVATITVRVRSAEESVGETAPGDLVAVRDAVITQVFPETGTAQVSPGQAVRAGQVLISGYTDLGIMTREDRAAGEVYGVTQRQVRSVLPEKTAQRQETGQIVRRYTLILGKKRVNFTNDSGILHTSCVKMRKVNYLTLPGGFELPVALVTETYFLCETETAERTGEEETLLDAARRDTREQMIAGEITGEELSFGGNRLDAVFECREMIGRFRPGVYWEGDTNDDRENGERGAG